MLQNIKKKSTLFYLFIYCFTFFSFFFKVILWARVHVYLYLCGKWLLHLSLLSCGSASRMTFVYISCLTQVFIFFGEMFLCMNWAIVADILLVSFCGYFLMFMISWGLRLKIHNISVALSLSLFLSVCCRPHTALHRRGISDRCLSPSGRCRESLPHRGGMRHCDIDTIKIHSSFCCFTLLIIRSFSFPMLGVGLTETGRLLHVAVPLFADLSPALFLCCCGGRSLLPHHSPVYWKRPSPCRELRSLRWVDYLLGKRMILCSCIYSAAVVRSWRSIRRCHSRP